MPVTTRLASQLRKLSAREKAVVADHLWREAEGKFSATPSQIATLNERLAKAVGHPRRLRPIGDALARLRK
jgi:hypothetical protein